MVVWRAARESFGFGTGISHCARRCFAAYFPGAVMSADLPKFCFFLALFFAGFFHSTVEAAERHSPPEIAGQVFSADGAPVHGLRFFLRAASFADSVDVDPAGRFSLALPEQLPDQVIELSLDAIDRATRRFHPALVWLRREELAGEQRFILVPREWTISQGSFAGTTVTTSLQRAFTPPCTGCSAFYERAGTRATFLARTPIQSWPEARFPLRVAFDREDVAEVFTARDSVEFWRVAESIHRDVGSELFRPVRYEETLAGEGEGEPEDVILVWVDPSLPYSGLGTAVSEGGKIVHGSVRLRRAGLTSSTGAPELLTHELVHALGFGHTCAWRSVVADPTRCRSLRSPSLTPEDVAYMQLLRRVRELQQTHRARWGIETALAGERVLTLRLPLERQPR
ncbi:hypothetical protein BH20GEM3_BH20GEM3_09880 [soil metagenome]